MHLCCFTLLLVKSDLLMEHKQHNHVCRQHHRLHLTHGCYAFAAGQTRQNVSPDAIWEQLAEAHKAGIPVKGRVLNELRGGYAVGLSGLVAFCPFTRCSVLTASRIGILQPFKIDRMTEERRNIVVADYRMELVADQRQQRWNRTPGMRQS